MTAWFQRQDVTVVCLSVCVSVCRIVYCYHCQRHVTASTRRCKHIIRPTIRQTDRQIQADTEAETVQVFGLRLQQIIRVRLESQ